MRPHRLGMIQQARWKWGSRRQRTPAVDVGTPTNTADPNKPLADCGWPAGSPTDATSSTSALGLDRQNQQPSTGLTALAAADAPELATSMNSERPSSSAENGQQKVHAEAGSPAHRPACSAAAGWATKLRCHAHTRAWSPYQRRAPHPAHPAQQAQQRCSREPVSWQARSMASTLSNCTWQKLFSLPAVGVGGR